MNYLNISGFGTVLYGTRNKNPVDNSYTTTGWIILLYFPIIPIGSYRVVLGSQRGIIIAARVKYQKFERIKFDRRQIINTYLLWWTIPIILIVLLSIYH